MGRDSGWSRGFVNVMLQAVQVCRAHALQVLLRTSLLELPVHVARRFADGGTDVPRLGLPHMYRALCA